MKVKDEAIEKLDVESLIVDLLACGLGGCIILFFIFSIKIIGNSVGQMQQADNANSDGQFANMSSMMGDDGKSKSMGAIRIVKISNLSPDNLGIIRAKSDNVKSFWTISIPDNREDLSESLRFQIKEEPNGISFIITANGMLPIDFEIPGDMGGSLESQDPGDKPIVEVMIIEGSSQRDNFPGLFNVPPTRVQNINKLKIHIDIGKLADLDKLVKIDTQ
ncbi:hypothetical protein QWZ08_04440 [Ferruginibacter paludis]|uniref:hypothetical protein n=1 Tax=Ferruginibacter paludis TaxID=1310417 RepID=UPI0025B3FA99|nr:hypothetical protein [Ferruginibacter paludis]MDN3654864.1 hypothetical protein [Ferruginibacter paludis]